MRTGIEVKCEKCGEIFTKIKAEVKRRPHHFCSKKCFYGSDFVSKFNLKSGTTFVEGRLKIKDIKNSRKDSRGYVFEHILKAQIAMGKALDKKHQVHHIDEDITNNNNDNLVICEDQSYHKLLHGRTKIIQKGGNPKEHKICSRCNNIKLRSEFSKNKSEIGGLQYICKSCSSEVYKNGY